MADNSSSSKQSINGLPTIRGRNSSLRTSPRQHEQLAKLNWSYVSQKLAHDDAKLTFDPPNITFFKQADTGQKGTLFNTKNERMSTDHEAQLIENRVRILKKEEEKMLKKINEARRQA